MAALVRKAAIAVASDVPPLNGDFKLVREPSECELLGEPEKASRGGRHVLFGLFCDMSYGERLTVAELVARWSVEEQDAAVAASRDAFDLGRSCAGADSVELLRQFARFETRQHLDEWGLAAFTLGVSGAPFVLSALVSEVSLVVHGV